ncbi:hypothetical protein ACQR1W_14205 [Bradyrhizobium sp. HKCCYLS1011]|uniref:hypothetical protein n=1 Tax=Bradyrhizobium sp. HKCCYLS1011 TaxID=3420733 RepID=UPI003EBC91F8
MRKTDSTETRATSAHRALTRALKLSAATFGIGLLLASGVARAQDDEQGEDDKTFEEKIIDNIMRGMGATNMETPTIDYRERSPLVVPPKLDLPPPAAATEAAVAPNWPKDPDVQRRKAAAAARKKDNKDPVASARPLTPAEMKVGTTAPEKKSNDPIQPGVTNNPMLSPSQLGFKGGLFGMFKGNDTESKPFTNEPTRESLTQPPPGYQTPSSNYAYGTGPMEPLDAKHFDIQSGKER